MPEAYLEVFAGREDAIDRSVNPLVPGRIVATRRDGDRVVVSVLVPARTLTAAQRGKLVKRYGPDAPKGLRERVIRVKVSREDGRLVVAL